MPAQSDAIPSSTKGDSSASSEPIPNNRKQSLLWIDYWSQQRITSTQKHLAHGWKLTCLMSIPGQLQVNQYALDSYKANLVSFSPQSRLHHTRGQHPASNWFPVLIQPDADPWPIQCQCGFWSNPEPVPHLSQSMLIQCQTTNALPITRLQDDMPIHHWSAPKHANQLQPTHIIGMTLDWHQMTGHWH